MRQKIPDLKFSVKRITDNKINIIEETILEHDFDPFFMNETWLAPLSNEPALSQHHFVPSHHRSRRRHFNHFSQYFISISKTYQCCFTIYYI